MKKIKFLIAGLFSAIALVFACVVGTRVNAATTTYGTDVVTTKTYTGDTRTWGFTTNLPSSNTKLNTGDDNSGIIVSKGNTEVSFSSSASNGFIFKSDSTASFSYTGIDLDSKGALNDAIIVSKTNAGLTGVSGACFYVPVPENSVGSITLLWASNDSKRGLLFDKSTEYLYVKSNKTSPGTKIDFTQSEICQYNSTGSYLKFISVDVGGKSKENKMGSIVVNLTTGTYGESATLHTVTYMDGTTTLKTDAETVDGSNITYTPKKYGYDFEGWYTESTLDNKISNSYTVTDDVTLYANWTAWTNTGIEEYTLSNAAIGKIATGIDGSLSADLLLTQSIYTAMTGVSMTTTSVTLPGASSATQAPCFNTNGAVSTSGNGIKFTAPSNGVFTTWIGSGGGSSRDIKFTSDGSTLILPTTGNANDLKIRYSNTGAEDPYAGLDVVGYEPRELLFAVEAGTTYYLGGTNGVRIYYISFEEETTLADNTTAAVFAEKNTTGTTLRFVGTLTGITALANIDKIELFLKKDGVAAANPIELTTCYTSVINTSQTCEEADNTYYVIFRLTGIDKLAAGTKISKQLKVTFTDGSSTISDVTEFTL